MKQHSKAEEKIHFIHVSANPNKCCLFAILGAFKKCELNYLAISKLLDITPPARVISIIPLPFSNFLQLNIDNIPL